MVLAGQDARPPIVVADVASFRQAISAQRRAGRLKRLRRPPAAHVPRLLEREYYKSLTRVLDGLLAIVRRTVLPRLAGIVAQAPPELRGDTAQTSRGLEVQRHDQFDDAIKSLLSEVKIQFLTETKPAASIAARTTASKVSEAQDRDHMRAVTSVLGVRPDLAEPWLGPVIDNFVSTNTRLIEDLSEGALDGVARSIGDGVRSGRRAEDIAAQIVDDLDRVGESITLNRARLIAEDQVGSLYGDLARVRNQKLGLNRYTWSCFSPDTRVSGFGIKAVARKRYEGSLIRVTSASGRMLSVTPEHKVLTNRGWVAAGCLHDGDYLVGYLPEVERTIAAATPSAPDSLNRVGASFPMPNVNNVPPTASEVFDTADEMLSGIRVMPCVVDFYRKTVDGEIEVIWTNGGLSRNIQAPCPKDLRESVLKCTDATFSDLVGGCSFTGYGESEFSSCIHSPQGISSADSGFSRLSAGAQDPGLRESSSNVTKVAENSSDSGLRAPMLHGQLPGGHPADILFAYDRCDNIEVIPFSGHVYDLTTEGRWLVADSFVVHNCSLDERVRPSHLERCGETFDWNEAIEPQLREKDLDVDKIDGHPGKPIRCRCIGVPVFGDLLDDVPEVMEPRVRSPRLALVEAEPVAADLDDAED